MTRNDLTRKRAFSKTCTEIKKRGGQAQEELLGIVHFDALLKAHYDPYKIPFEGWIDDTSVSAQARDMASFATMTRRRYMASTTVVDDDDINRFLDRVGALCEGRHLGMSPRIAAAVASILDDLAMQMAMQDTVVEGAP